MQQSTTRLTSPLAVWEAAIAIACSICRSPRRPKRSRAISRFEIKMVNVAPETRIALKTYDRHGKGRDTARLNFGDCFAYACARHLGEPLMFKGADFSQTDIEAA